jgi:choline/glycine/proline betaine transport protein
MENDNRQSENPHVYGGGQKSFHPVVFPVSAGLILLFIAITLFFSDQAKEIFSTINEWIGHHAGWFFILVVNLFLLTCFALMFCKSSGKRLGGPDARPDFTYSGWFAMLFSAGMGIGLVFWGVAEPMTHFTSPATPDIPPDSIDAARSAMAFTYFHWGLHAWGIYALVGLAMAYFSFNKKLPLTMRSALYPILGEKVRGPWGNVIDIMATVSTLFGVATSLGFGVTQINAGLEFVFGSPESPAVQVLLIAVITGVATMSVVLGLDKGVRRLSEINMYLASAMLLFVLIAGPTVFLLNSIVQNFGEYAQKFLYLSTWTDTYYRTDWRQGWTVFYWAWWIAWSPFVGMFIARISRGRTIREFLLGVLLVPTAMTFVWISIFGNAAIRESLDGNPAIAAAVSENVATSLFALMNNLPWHQISSVLGILVIVLFFVTSSDSASFVIDIITSGGHTNPPVPQRIFWAVLEGVVAAVLLTVGGTSSLEALQTASILTGLPFAIVIVLIAVAMLREMAGPGSRT